MVNIAINIETLLKKTNDAFDNDLKQKSFNLCCQYDNAKIYVLVLNHSILKKDIKKKIKDLGIKSDAYKLIITDNLSEVLEHYKINQYIDINIKNIEKNKITKNDKFYCPIILDYNSFLKTNSDIVVVNNWMELFTILNMIIVNDHYKNTNYLKEEVIKNEKNMDNTKV